MAEPRGCWRLMKIRRGCRLIQGRIARVQESRLKVWLLIISVAAVTFGMTLKFTRASSQDRLRSVSRSGSVITVAANGNLQQALNDARCGDTILLEASATFLAAGDAGFMFPAKTGGPC